LIASTFSAITYAVEKFPHFAIWYTADATFIILKFCKSNEDQTCFQQFAVEIILTFRILMFRTNLVPVRDSGPQLHRIIQPPPASEKFNLLTVEQIPNALSRASKFWQWDEYGTWLQQLK
jgi:hypothetical protein